MFTNKALRKSTFVFKTASDIISLVFFRHGNYRFLKNHIRTHLQSKIKPVTWVSFFFATRAFSLFRSKEQPQKNQTYVAVKPIENLLSEADELYNENKYIELYELLYPHKDDNEEILWRLARLLYNMSKQESSKEEKKRLVFEAYEFIDKALAINDSNFAVHKWYAILLDMRASYDGIKARVKELENVKTHMMRAVELNPKDATTFHMLGFWCFNISSMTWFQKKIASTLFAKPPSSSFEEALFYFNKAEEVEPNFYSQNLLMLGKTYLQLKKEEKARYYLKLASNYPPRTDDDLQARKEAADLLKNMEK
ncbi:hypothetical protein L9F63_003908 [Diploptera punctata]|uniref:Regulator of microtubule dynamics protein 1 n=1 Tax=Diploptera punctata TaxID=6984 RepID=A0AAD7ZJG9_DIPPU|nr:hypothetical protein L9F63_003908 [Diploptera punctata]